MPSFTNSSTPLIPNTERIEVHVRSALAFGKISASTEVEIDQLAKQGKLSSHEAILLAVLRDAIQDGSIQREGDHALG
ncbi:MAG: hypothetical protein KME16_01450 [Scytolyngbya sp. HA4215-MV1]|jgi:hypothetical protein|nr:hypothetical protein [Scytolyngbya sp. HA4215-MV1]